jgi:GTP cyclohydrolase I
MIDKRLILGTEPNPIQEEIARHYQEILRLLGEDTQREGLLKTPKRIAKAMQFLTYVITLNPKNCEIAKFPRIRQMVIVRDIILSMCEHHSALLRQGPCSLNPIRYYRLERLPGGRYFFPAVYSYRSV